jgi:hypothetical protein
MFSSVGNVGTCKLPVKERKGPYTQRTLCTNTERKRVDMGALRTTEELDSSEITKRARPSQGPIEKEVWCGIRGSRL